MMIIFSKICTVIEVIGIWEK